MTGRAASIDGIAALGDVAQSPTLERTMEAVRELLGMEVAYATEFGDTHGVLAHMQGDGQSFGIAEGMSVPLEQTYCQRILTGACRT